MFRLGSLGAAVVLLAAACGSVAPPTNPQAAAMPAGAAPAGSVPAPFATPPASAAPSGSKPWSLVVVGDSIPFNSPDDCPGCTAFVDRYAARIYRDTGHAVKVSNLSQHNGLHVDALLQEIETDQLRRDALASADIIVVGIAHNDAPWSSDTDLCDGPSTELDWSKFTTKCVDASVAALRPMLEHIYTAIVDLRAGKPTIFRTINRYNDWIGDDTLPPGAARTSRDVVSAYSAMQCKVAAATGFTCADINLAFNGKDGLKPSGDLLGKDFTHPSDKGNEVIAGVLADLGYAPLWP